MAGCIASILLIDRWLRFISQVGAFVLTVIRTLAVYRREALLPKFMVSSQADFCRRGYGQKGGKGYLKLTAQIVSLLYLASISRCKTDDYRCGYSKGVHNSV